MLKQVVSAVFDGLVLTLSFVLLFHFYILSWFELSGLIFVNEARYPPCTCSHTLQGVSVGIPLTRARLCQCPNYRGARCL